MTLEVVTEMMTPVCYGDLCAGRVCFKISKTECDGRRTKKGLWRTETKKKKGEAEEKLRALYWLYITGVVVKAFSFDPELHFLCKTNASNLHCPPQNKYTNSVHMHTFCLSGTLRKSLQVNEELWRGSGVTFQLGTFCWPFCIKNHQVQKWRKCENGNIFLRFLTKFYLGYFLLLTVPTLSLLLFYSISIQHFIHSNILEATFVSVELCIPWLWEWSRRFDTDTVFGRDFNHI